MPHRRVLWMQGLCVGVFVCALISIGHGAASASMLCVSTAAELASALLTAEANGETDVIQMIRGTYQGHFTYISSEPHGLTLEGGYLAGCVSRSVEPSTTVLDGLDEGPVFIVRADQGGPVTVDGVTLQHGGGDGSTAGVSLTAQGNLTLMNNLIRYNAGWPSDRTDAVDLVSGGTLTVANSTITANGYAFESSVAMNGDTVIVANNTITGNTSRFTGGLRVDGNAVTVTNTVISGNTGTYPGGSTGGLAVSGHKVIVTNNTVTGNIGSGIYLSLRANSDTADLYNNIVWSNAAATGADLFLENDGNEDGQPSPMNLFSNDFDTSSAGTFMTLPFPIDPSNLHNVNPSFVDAENDDYHLQAGSPVIDQGDNSAPGLPLRDQEGRPRILQGTVDLGAFEFGVVDIVHITRAAFFKRGLFLLISASSSATPTAQLFVTVPPCITDAPMTLTGNMYLYFTRVPSCGPLDGQTATVHSSFGGSDSAPLQ
jgi:Right handed beta helix region